MILELVGEQESRQEALHQTIRDAVANGLPSENLDLLKTIAEVRQQNTFRRALVWEPLVHVESMQIMASRSYGET